MFFYASYPVPFIFTGNVLDFVIKYNVVFNVRKCAH